MKKFYIALIAIVIFGAIVRLYQLGRNPLSPYWEEVALGYDAYSISQTGKDMHGNPYPIISFPSFGDYKPSGYFYTLVPFIKIFGLNVLAVRLPSAVAGIIAAVLVFLIGKELFDRRVGLISAGLLSISPWAIQFSRGGWEVNLAMALVLGGGYCLLRARRQVWWLLLAVILMSASVYTYHAARLFAPLIGGLGGLLLIIDWRSKSKNFRPLIAPLLASISLALLLVLPLVINLKSKEVSSRFSQTTVLSDLQPVLDSNAKIQEHGSTSIARLIYHRYWFYGKEVATAFLRHFSPQFLFVRGDGNLRHWNGRYGLLFSLDAVFLAVTTGVLFLSHRDKRLKGIPLKIILVIVWIMLAAVPAALVKPTPHALRFLFAAPGFVILVAVGISTILKLLPKDKEKIFVLVIVAAYSYLFASYYFWYMNIYPVRSASDWQYGYKQVLSVLEKEKKQNEKVYMTRDEGRPSMYYLFYSQYDPAKIQSASVSLPKDQLELLQVDDYYFVDSVPNTKGLFATPVDKVLPQAKILNTIRRPDGSAVWVVWRK